MTVLSSLGSERPEADAPETEPVADVSSKSRIIQLTACSPNASADTSPLARQAGKARSRQPGVDLIFQSHTDKYGSQGRVHLHGPIHPSSLTG